MSTDASSPLDPTTLPDDPALLKRLLVEREQQRFAERESLVQLIERVRAEAAAQLTAQAARLAAEQQAAIEAAVQAAVLAILRRYYGPRSEKFDPRQLLLFGQHVLQTPLNAQSIEQEAGEKLTTRRVKRRDNHGRQTLPEHLERIEIEHDLKPAEKQCPTCGHERCRIGAEVSEQLEYFPANFKVLQHIRHKYACQKCNHDGYNPNITTAKKPPQPIERGLPGPSLLTEVACWAHARRKFFDAQDSDLERATQMLALIGELYQVERELKEACAGAWQELARDEQLARIAAARQERSVPVLARIKSWLDAEQELMLPRSPLAAAITYAQNQWAALHVYTTQGYLNIDNNASERALKRVALGRKNWLFAGHDDAAQNHARLWSLIASAERHAIDPQAYLTSVFAKLGQLPRDNTGQIPAAELEPFLPDVWKREDAAEPLAPTAE